MKFASLFFFPFSSLFDVWVFTSDLIYWNPRWWVFNPWWICLLLYFYFFFFFSLFDVWIFAYDLYHFGACGDGFSSCGDEVYIFYIWVFRPMLISKIKRPRYQTEQYPQATTFPWFIYPYPWALLSFSKLLLNLFKFYKKELLIFTLK